ncbi:hypothetical protein ABTX62_34125 [Streptomyces sp. NPDC096046]|uniref:hypothetical protein n=1 Tax=Streptomyces sp. NPDC096046 TaxID=3155542 RepID=UPI00332D9EFA
MSAAWNLLWSGPRTPSPEEAAGDGLLGRRLVLAAVDPYIDRDVLARQMAREEEQRRALAAFLDGWDAAGGGAAPS